jgi:hypothetical protein
MFVAVMVSLTTSAQQRVATAQAQIGTGITVSTTGSGQIGGSSTTDQYITTAQVSTVEKTAGVTSISEYVTTRDTGGKIKGAVTIPTNIPTFTGSQNGNGPGTGRGFFGGTVDGTIAPTIQGVLPGQSPLTLSNGVALTIKSGRNMATAESNANVALTSQALATANGYAVGSTISLNGTNVKLVGLYTASDRFDENTIVLPLQTAQRIYKINGVTGLTAYADSVADVDTVATRLRSALGSNLSVVSQGQILTCLGQKAPPLQGWG